MAIRKGIEPGDILWKKVEEFQYANGEQAKRYHVYILETRRARTLGTRISPDMAPLFEKLNIKLTPIRAFYSGYPRTEENSYIQSYIAVGVSLRHQNESNYISTQISPSVSCHYDKLTNQSFSTALSKINNAEEQTLTLSLPDSFIPASLVEHHSLDEYDPFI